MSNERDTSEGIAKRYLSQEHIEQLEEGYRAVPRKCQKLSVGFLTRAYNNARAREYAMHGFSRRLSTLARCIDNAFGILPPNFVGLPTRDQLSDTAINVQAFVFNAFGSLDNLAWIWVSEKGLTKKDGSPIPNTWVGLGKGNTLVRDSFSAEFQVSLRELDGWFDHLEDFRHALAHRIPLYIPPYVVSEANQAAYREHQDRINAAIAHSDFVAYDRLSAEQDALGIFRPWVTHAVGDQQATPVMLHSQLLADFATVEAVAQKVLAELDR